MNDPPHSVMSMCLYTAYVIRQYPLMKSMGIFKVVLYLSCAKSESTLNHTFQRSHFFQEFPGNRDAKEQVFINKLPKKGIPCPFWGCSQVANTPSQKMGYSRGWGQKYHGFMI